MYRIIAFVIAVSITTLIAIKTLDAMSLGIGKGPQELSIGAMLPAARLEDGKAVDYPAFGGKFEGRDLWLSANGRYAALFRLTDDTDKNGELNVEFGMHGESWGDELALDLFNIETGQHQRYDDLLSSDATGRYAVLTRGENTLLFDSADGSVRNLHDLGGGAPADANRCMSPRQIVFDDTGGRIALLRDQPAEVRIVDVARGESRVVYRPEKPLWRVAFTADPSWLLAIEATGEFPVQPTSCVSLSRTVFAASYSRGPIQEDQLSYALIDAHGRRHPVSDAPILLGDSVYLLPESGQVLRVDDEPITLPAECKPADGATGSRVVLLDCEKSTQLLDPDSGKRYILPDGMSMSFLDGARATGADGTWYAVTFPIAGAGHESNAQVHLGRVRLEDLQIERGPALYFNRHSGNPDWLVGGRGDDYFMMNVANGTLLTTHAKETESRYDPLALRTDTDSWLLLDPEKRRQAPVRARIGTGNGHGCFLASSGSGGTGLGEIDLGPWKRFCVHEAARTN